MAVASAAFLHAVTIEGKPYILRGLQPSEDRVALNRWNGKIRRLEEVLATMGQVLAWDHLRSSGRGGSAIADELVEFGQRTDWKKRLHEAGIHCAAVACSDWKTYAEAFDEGYFN